MANIADLKITEEKTSGKHVADLPVNPSEINMSAQELQKRFDELPEVAIKAFNELLDALLNKKAGDDWMPTASDVGAVARQEALSTSILEKALTLSSGIHHFRLSGGAYTGGDLPTNSYRYCSATVHVRQATSILVVLHGTNHGIYPQSNYYDGNGWLGWTPFFLPLDGSVAMSGDLKIKKAGRTANYPDSHLLLEQLSSGVTGMYNMTTNSIYTGLAVNPIYEEDTTTPKALFRVKNPNINKWYELHHAGNKPSGSYTGNGSATKREINIGGIGKVLMIVQARNLTFVWNGGGVTLNPEVSGGTVLHTASEIKFVNDVLTIATDKPNVNYSTGVYEYYRF